MRSRYDAPGLEGEFEPGSRGRVLRNLLGIRRVRDMEQAESEALLAVQEHLVSRYSVDHRFTAADLRYIHRAWLGRIYAWAGDYRRVNITKDGFMFAAASQIGRQMARFERRFLRRMTPCAGMNTGELARALAATHAELVIIHPFREGNGRCARLLALLMGLQAGLPPLDFTPLSGRGKRSYIRAIHAAVAENYAPMEALFEAIVRRTLRAYAK